MLNRILERAWRNLAGRTSSRQPDLEITRLPDWHAYLAYRNAHPDRAAEQARLERTLIPLEDEFELDGHCHVCNAARRLQVDLKYGHLPSRTPNWRERLVCAGCGLNNRMRAAVHVFEQVCSPRNDSAIYLSEAVTPLYQTLAGRFASVTGSEYLGDRIAFGASDERGVRNESLTRLSFPDESFDYVLTFDVLEHIPDYAQALRECLRVLKHGGQLLLSAPFVLEAHANIPRARILPGGEIEHLLPPEYHGDPLTDAGCLSFFHFGWALLDDLREAGFAKVEACLYWSEAFGYLGGDQLFILAQKR